MPPRHGVQAKAYDPNRFNVVFHCMFFCIRNKQALVQTQAAETGTAALRKAAKGLTWRRSSCIQGFFGLKCWALRSWGGGQCLEQPPFKTSQNQINSIRTALRKKSGGGLLDKVLTERTEIACRKTVSYCLIPFLFKEKEFYTSLVNKRAASKHLDGQFCLLLETIRWDYNHPSALVKGRK